MRRPKDRPPPEPEPGEGRCDCGALVLRVERGDGEGLITLDWYASEDGYVVVRRDRAAVLESAERAIALLEMLGVTAADRYVEHVCS